VPYSKFIKKQIDAGPKWTIASSTQTPRYTVFDEVQNTAVQKLQL